MAKSCSDFQGGGRRHPPSSDAITFFKIMIGPFKTTLYIPPHAAARLDTLVNHSAYLEDSNGKLWKVEVLFVENSLAFNQGWSQFVLDHDIATGEFVVFSYKGGQKFSLQIFGMDGCLRLSFPVNNDLSNEHSPVRKRKPSADPETTGIGQVLQGEDSLTASKTSLSYDKQSLNIKNTLTNDTPEGCKYKRPGIPVLKKRKVGNELAEKSSGIKDKQKRRVNHGHKNSSQLDVGTGECNSSIDVLENRGARGTEGAKFLVDKNGVCFFVIDEHEIVEPNNCLPAPISVDVSAMTNNTLVTNEVISPDLVIPTVTPTLPKLNCCDNHDAAVQDSSMDHLQDGDLDFVGSEPDTTKKDEAPSVENALCCINYVDLIPECPKPTDPAEKPLDEAVTREIPLSCEDPPQCIDQLPEFPGSGLAYLHSPDPAEKPLDQAVTREIPLSCEDPQCIDQLPEFPGSPKPIGVEALEPEAVLALPEPVRFSFSVDDKSQWYQVLSSSLPTKRMRIDRKVVLLRDSSRRVWPVVYHENHDAKFTGFSSGWSSFASANSIKGGDTCILELSNESDALFDVQISSA